MAYEGLVKCPEQQKLAESFTKEIDEIIEKFLGGADVRRRDEVRSQISNLLLISMILPVIIGFISGIGAVTVHYLTLVTNLVDVVPPFLQRTRQEELDYINKSLDQQRNLISLKHYIIRLAIRCELKDETLKEIEDNIKKLKDELAKIIKT